MGPIERCTVLPEPGTKVFVEFEHNYPTRDQDDFGYEDHWVDGVVLAHEVIDGETRAVVELDTQHFDIWTRLTSYGRVEVVGSVRVHCWAELLAIAKEFPPRDGPFVSPLYGPASPCPPTAVRTG